MSNQSESIQQMHYSKIRQMKRQTRCQGLIVQDDHLLLIRVKDLLTGKEYWVIPGGGIEDHETEEECVIREMQEETNLEVIIDRLLYDEHFPPGEIYQQVKTYLCRPLSGEARPGSEPEAADEVEFIEVRWFDLMDESDWGEELCQDPYTYPTLFQLRKTLGYRI